MSKCWNCNTEITLKEEDTKCDNCGKVVRFWCNSCKQPFDIEKENKEKLKECKWCFFFTCPNCGSCSPTCPKYEHSNKIKQIINGLVAIDKWNELDIKIKQIVNYFEDIKSGKEKTTCMFGVPKTYAKERVKGYLVKMEGYKTRDIIDKTRFEERHNKVTDKPEGYEFTIKKSREPGTFGQEYRDVFNLCVCLGELKYKRKKFLDKSGFEIEYDSWTRISNPPCPYLHKGDLIVKYCKKCKTTYPKEEIYCSKCSYKKNTKHHQAGDKYELENKITNADTCKLNRGEFKKRGKNGG